MFMARRRPKLLAGFRHVSPSSIIVGPRIHDVECHIVGAVEGDCLDGLRRASSTVPRTCWQFTQSFPRHIQHFYKKLN